jgi:DNA-binding NtrC family response regulator
MREKTILIVDDDPNIVSAFKNSLQREAYSILGAESVSEALEQIATGAIDLIITDIKLRGLSGLSLLIQLGHRQPHKAELPVIVITGYNDWISENDLRLLGAAEVFLKPVDLPKIRESIHRLLDHSLETTTRQ